MTDVISLLKESGAMLEGHFLLSSGRHSDKYVQCAQLLKFPDRAAAVIKVCADQIRAAIESGKIKVDIIAGPAMGGIIVAYELGRQLGIPAIFTERDENGLMVLRRGFEIEKKQHILIAEDAVTTAKSSLETAKALEEKGAIVAGLACIADRRQDLSAPQWPVFAAVKINAENWDAENCTLCKKGIPAVKPGSRKINTPPDHLTTCYASGQVVRPSSKAF